MIKTLSTSIAVSTRSLTVTSSQTSGLIAGTNYKIEVRDTTTGAVADESETFEVLASTPSPAPPGSISVTKPAGSCQANGSPCAVVWSMSFTGGRAAPSKVRITYSGGSPSTTGTVISEVGATSANYAWSIPRSLAGGSYFFHVSSIGITPNVAGTSSQFTINAAASVMVVKPITGDSWVIGQPAVVSWIGVNIATSDLDSVNINLVDASGTHVLSLSVATTSSSSGGSKSNVTIPSSSHVTIGDGYKVRVTSTTDSTLTADSQTFFIAQPTIITLESPSAGGSYFRGSTMPIRWTSSGIVNDIRLQLVDSSENIVQISAEPWTTAPGKNAFDFEVPPQSTIASGYTIRITALDNAMITFSSFVFDLAERPFIDVITPLHGQSMTIAKSNAVEWLDAANVVGAGVQVNVVLSRGESQVQTIAEQSDNDGLEIWYADPTKVSSSGTGYHAVVESAAASSSPLSKLYAVIGDYPGLDSTRIAHGSFATVELATAGGGITVRYGFRFVSSGGRNGQRHGGFHVHTGTSCEAAHSVGGHFYTKGEDDPFVDTEWTTESNTFTLSSTAGLPALSNMEGKVIVVHSQTGERIGCGVLRSTPYGVSDSFSLERPLTITVKREKGGRRNGVWEIGQTHPVRWTMLGGFVENVDISMVSSTEKSTVPTLSLATNARNEGWLMVNTPTTAIVGEEYVMIVSSSSGIAAIAVPGEACVVAAAAPTNRRLSGSTPSIAVVYPSKSTVEHGLTIGNTIRIVWNFTHSNVATHVSVSLAFNSSALTVLVASTPNVGSWEWTPSNKDLNEGTRYVLHVTPINGASLIVGIDGLSNEFALLLPSPEFFNVELSEGHHGLIKGSSNIVRWATIGGGSDRVGDVDLTLVECDDLMCAKSQDVYSIGRSTETGVFTWQVPLLSPPIASTMYAIRLSSSLHPSSITAISEQFIMSDFSCDMTIGSGVACADERRFEVTAPKAGVKIVRGSSVNIRWTLSGQNQKVDWTEQSVMIMLYDGDTVQTSSLRITSQHTNTGLFRWFVPLDLKLGSSYTVQVYPVDRMTLDSEKGIFKFRSTCPPQSQADAQCESGTFSVISAEETAPALEVKVETGSGADGLTLVHHSTHVVSWETVIPSLSGVGGEEKSTVTISLVLSSNPKAPILTVCENQPTSGECVWIVDNIIDVESYPKLVYQIRADLLNGDGSNEIFALTNSTYRVAQTSSLNVTRPGFQDVLEKGSTYNVLFEYTGVPFDLDIFLYAGSSNSRHVIGSIAGEKEGECIFPFLYLGQKHYSCIRESTSTHFRGEEWCATEVDVINLHPVKRGVCESLPFIKRLDAEELTIYSTDGVTPSMMDPWSSSPRIPVEDGFVRWTPSEMSLPAQGSQYHLVLSSIDDRTMIQSSQTFVVLCASYAMQVQLKLGSATPKMENVIEDLANNLKVPTSMIGSIMISANNRNTLPIVVSFSLSSQLQTICPIEAYGTLIKLWSTTSGTGFLKDMDSTVEPTKQRIDKSDLLPGGDIVVSVVVCLFLFIIFIEKLPRAGIL